MRPHDQDVRVRQTSTFAAVFTKVPGDQPARPRRAQSAISASSAAIAVPQHRGDFARIDQILDEQPVRAGCRIRYRNCGVANSRNTIRIRLTPSQAGQAATTTGSPAIARNSGSSSTMRRGENTQRDQVAAQTLQQHRKTANRSHRPGPIASPSASLATRPATTHRAGGNPARRNKVRDDGSAIEWRGWRRSRLRLAAGRG